MTKNKRFIPIFDGLDKRVVGAKDNGRIISFMDMFDLLNDYAYENEQLKIDIGIAKDNHKLDKEIIDDIHNEYQKIKKENEQLKADNNRLVNETAKVVAEHQKRVLDLIDEKIEHYQKQPLLAVRIPNCEHRKSCLHNQEINVCNKAKENAYRELKKEL